MNVLDKSKYTFFKTKLSAPSIKVKLRSKKLLSGGVGVRFIIESKYSSLKYAKNG